MTKKSITIIAILFAVIFTACTVEPDRNADGEIEESGDLSSTNIKVGDCFDYGEVITEAGVEDSGTVQAIPCDQLHTYEAYYTTDLEDGDYPGDAAIESQTEEICNVQFEQFVGIDYNDSALSLIMQYPSEETFDSDKSITCSVYDETQKLTGSAKDKKI